MKTKWVKVAQSGKTIDGREITPAQIDQMANSYDPKTYGARIWVEHLRSFLPDSPFKAYGDVLALKSEDAGAGQRALFAQIDATPELVKLNADRQKVYWSIELDPAFAGTGQAYMVGLAVTDSPAALATEMMRFSLSGNKIPDAVKGHLFTVHVEGGKLEEDSAAAPADNGPSLFSKVKDLLTGKGKADEQRFSQLEQAVLGIAEEVSGIKTTLAGFTAGKPDASASAGDLTAKVDKLSADLAGLITALNGASPNQPRPLSNGQSTTFTATDC